MEVLTMKENINKLEKVDQKAAVKESIRDKIAKARNIEQDKGRFPISYIWR